MITKTAPLKTTKAFPLEKSDIQYDPSREEVSIPREKFDAFVKYVEALQEKLEAAEDARDVAQYRAHKAGKTADVLETLIKDVLKASAAIREWLKAPGHTLQELSERSGISYATCHRIVNERLGTTKLEIGHLQKMVAAVSRGQLPLAVASKQNPRFKRILFGLPKGFLGDDLVSGWVTQGSKVETVHGGVEIAQRAHELHPDLIVVDVSMPFGKSGLEQLKEFAKDEKTTIVLTGEIKQAHSALFEDSFDPSPVKEPTSEGKTAGG